MGFSDITTQDNGIKVYRKEVDYKGNKLVFYSTPLYSKKSDGSFVTYYMDLGFKKGIEVGNKAEIKINKSFLTCTEVKGVSKPKLFVMDFEIIKQGVDADGAGFVDIPEGIDEELPFN